MFQMIKKEDISPWIISASIAFVSGFIPNDFLQPAMRAPGGILLTILHVQQLSPIFSNIFDIASVILTALIITFPLRIKNSLAIGAGVLALAIPALFLLPCNHDRCPEGLEMAVILPLYGIAVAAIYIVKEYLKTNGWISTILIGFMPIIIFAGLALLVTNILLLILYTIPLVIQLFLFVPGILLLVFGAISPRAKKRS